MGIPTDPPWIPSDPDGEAPEDPAPNAPTPDPKDAEPKRSSYLTLALCTVLSAMSFCITLPTMAQYLASFGVSDRCTPWCSYLALHSWLGVNLRLALPSDGA